MKDFPETFVLSVLISVTHILVFTLVFMHFQRRALIPSLSLNVCEFKADSQTDKIVQWLECWPL